MHNVMSIGGNTAYGEVKLFVKQFGSDLVTKLTLLRDHLWFLFDISYRRGKPYTLFIVGKSLNQTFAKSLSH